MRVLSVGDCCPEPLRLAVEEAGCFSDVFETVKPLAYHSDCYVSLVRCRATGYKTVVKSYIREQLSDNAKKQIAIEARIHSNLVHPTVIPLLLAFENSMHVYLAVQHADGGDLRKHMEEGVPMAEDHVRNWLAVPLLRALAEVHDQGVVHRDIKPENVLVHDGSPVLADFGMSVYSRPPADGDEEASSAGPLYAGGTPLYTAPEVILAMFKNKGVQHVVGPKNDIWAFGLVMLEVLTGRHPFSPEQAADGNVLFTIAHCSKVNLPTRLSSACQSFLAAALCRDPENRVDARALLDHEWLSSSSSSSCDCCDLLAAVGSRALVSAGCHAEVAWEGRSGGLYEPQRVISVVTCDQQDSWEF